MAAVTRRLLRIAVVLGAGALAGCSEGGTTPDPVVPPELRIVDGAGASDTVGAVLAQALVVEVRDSLGRAHGGAQVVFQAGAPGAEPDPDGIRVSGLASTAFRGSAAVTADERGRAAVLVQLGRRAGSAEITVAVPAVGLQRSATYTVRPGAPARIALSPADSVVMVGGSYPLTGTVQDRFGNARVDAVTLTPGTAAVSLAGTTVRGESTGRAHLVARSGALVDTAWVSVAPVGVLAAYEFPVYFNSNGPDIRQPGRIVTMNTDGSGFRVVLEQQPAVIPHSFAIGMHPVWAPGGGEIAYLNAQTLMAAPPSGLSRTLFSGSAPVYEETAPQFSPDGEWVYFSLGRHGSQRTFWRVRRDGTAPHQVSPDESWGVEVMPSPDPTGDLLVYQTNRATNSHEVTLRVLRVSTGEVYPLDVPGASPRWSPRGDWIAYFGRDGRLRRMRPDGSGIQVIGAGIGAHPTFSWSADGEWLVISGNQPRPGYPYGVGLSLVRVATGEVLPLHFGRELVQPAWRP